MSDPKLVRISDKHVEKLNKLLKYTVYEINSAILDTVQKYNLPAMEVVRLSDETLMLYITLLLQYHLQTNIRILLTLTKEEKEDAYDTYEVG